MKTDAEVKKSRARIDECPDLGFTKRWCQGNDEARRRGGWHLHVAGSQHGKTIANRIYCRNHPASRTPGTGTIAEVIAIVAPSDGRGSLARLIAMEIGGGGLRPQRPTRAIGAQAPARRRHAPDHHQ